MLRGAVHNIQLNLVIKAWTESFILPLLEAGPPKESIVLRRVHKEIFLGEENSDSILYHCTKTVSRFVRNIKT